MGLIWAPTEPGSSLSPSAPATAPTDKGGWELPLAHLGVDGRELLRHRRGRAALAHPPQAPLARRRVAPAPLQRVLQRGGVARGHEGIGLHELGQRPDAACHHGRAGRHRVRGGQPERLGRPRRDERHGGAPAQVREAVGADGVVEGDLGPARILAQRAAQRAVADDDERACSRRAASMATFTPFSGARREATRAYSPSAAAEFAAKCLTGWATTVARPSTGAASSRSRSSAA